MTLNSILIFSLSLLIASQASAGIIVDFTAPGPNGNVPTNPLDADLVFMSQDLNGTGVTFDITVSAVIPAGGGAFGGNIENLNFGLGSTVENNGTFLNTQGGVSEEILFTISNVSGLLAGQSIVLTDLLSQNVTGLNADQSGGFGGTFGQQAADSVTFTSDLGTSAVVNQTDISLGSILLAGDGGNPANTGDTFAHNVGNLAFTSSFSVGLTDLIANEAVVIQGLEFAVIPEPSTVLFMIVGGFSALLGRRKRRLA